MKPEGAGRVRVNMAEQE
jgi:hypothetical protein